MITPQEILEKIRSINPQDYIDYVKSVDPKIWIKVGVTFVIVVLLLVFFVYPSWVTRIVLRRDAAALKTQITATKVLLGQHKQLLASRDQYSAYNASVQSRLYRPGEASQLLSLISRIAQESKISIVASDPRPVGGYGPPFDARYVPIAYGLTLEGGYHSLALFISKLESTRELLKVQNFTIRPQDTTPDKEYGELTLVAIVRR